MSRAHPFRSYRLAATAAATIALAGCSQAPRRSPQDLAALSTCRQRADEVYMKQNRAELYRTDTFATSGRDSPFAATGLPGITTRGLSGQFQRDNMVDDCLNATAQPGAVAPAGGAGPSPSSPAPSLVP